MLKRKLDPREISFRKDRHENLFLKTGTGGRRVEKMGPVRVKQPFPLSQPEGYLVIEDEGGGFIGLISEYTKMDPRSLEIIDEQLEYSYFLPKITRIKTIDENFGLQMWEVDTDRGPRSFEVRSRKRDIRWLTDTHIVIQDADGNKYEIPNLDNLDEESVMKLEMEV